jgi:hypothetical protein
MYLGDRTSLMQKIGREIRSKGRTHGGALVSSGRADIGHTYCNTEIAQLCGSQRGVHQHLRALSQWATTGRGEAADVVALHVAVNEGRSSAVHELWQKHCEPRTRF